MAEKPLPKRRVGHTYELMIYSQSGGRTKAYLRTGLHEDGTLGEIFVDVAKFGSELRSLVNCWAIMVSIALQNGVPLQHIVSTFECVSFEPKGRVECPVAGVDQCTSIPDVVCRILQAEFLGKVAPPPAQPD